MNVYTIVTYNVPVYSNAFAQKVQKNRIQDHNQKEITALCNVLK